MCNSDFANGVLNSYYYKQIRQKGMVSGLDTKTELGAIKELKEEYLEPFMHLMMQYECAMLEVQTKLEVLNKELALVNSRNPFESIKARLKSPESIYGILIEMKDYIKNPKPNGYRSLHLILDIPIFLTGEKKHMRVEVQFRTIAMDFWASLEHKMKYKKDVENAESISEELKYCADLICQLDKRMQQIRNRIDNNTISDVTGIIKTEE